MKILLAKAQEIVDGAIVWEFVHKGDALLRPKYPFFKPDFSEEIRARLVLAAKITRVGKFIRKTFAHRYVTSIAPAIELRAEDLIRSSQNAGTSSSLGYTFEGSTLLGEETSIETLEGVSYQLKGSEGLIASLQPIELLDKLYEAIVHLSRYYTLKMGDYILLSTTEEASPILQQGERLEVFQGEKLNLRLDIK